MGTGIAVKKKVWKYFSNPTNTGSNTLQIFRNHWPTIRASKHRRHTETRSNDSGQAAGSPLW